MRREIAPQESGRAEAFKMWMSSPQPMVTLVKTLDVSRLVKVSKRTGMKFNMLLCWCIGKAASEIAEFYVLPEDGKLFQYDKLAINVIVDNSRGKINWCDVPFSPDLQQFNKDYLSLTSQAAKECKSISMEDHMIVGTSALPQTELDCIVNQYSGIFNNPFLAWGRYHKGWFKTTLPVSFQFHHVQMDGGHVVRFLEGVQHEINQLNPNK